MNTTTRLTLIEAAELDEEELEELCSPDLDLHPDEIKAACAIWAALLGVPLADSEGMEAAREEVMGDGPLIVRLCGRPAVEFVRWFRREEWDTFLRSDTEGEAWAWRVLDAARAAVGLLGCVATQVPLSAALVRRAAP